MAIFSVISTNFTLTILAKNSVRLEHGPTAVNARFAGYDVGEMDALWNEAKKGEYTQTSFGIKGVKCALHKTFERQPFAPSNQPRTFALAKTGRIGKNCRLTL